MLVISKSIREEERRREIRGIRREREGGKGYPQVEPGIG